MIKIRKCVSPTTWNGYRLQVGELFGYDEHGLFICRAEHWRGIMVVLRQLPGVEVFNGRTWVKPMIWADVLTPVSSELGRAVANIATFQPMRPHYGREEASAELKAYHHRRSWEREMQAGIVRKHKAKASHPASARNCDAYEAASAEIYGVVEINGRHRAALGSIANYMDGVW